MKKFLVLSVVFFGTCTIQAQKLYVHYTKDAPKTFDQLAAQPLPTSTEISEYRTVTLTFTQDDGKTEIDSYTLTPAQLNHLGWTFFDEAISGGIPVDCSELFDLNDTHWHFAGLTAQSFEFVLRLSDAAINGDGHIDRTLINAKQN